MNNVVRVGIVGAPHSGKTSLIQYLRKYLKDDYIVFTTGDVSDLLTEIGLDLDLIPSELDFQIECLKGYSSLYKNIDNYIKKFVKGESKPVVILYDTIPSIGQCYLNGSEDLHKWVEQFTKEKFGEYKMDLIFTTELLHGDYSRSKRNKIARKYRLDDIYDISDKINCLFKDSIELSSDLSIEERASLVVDQLDSLIVR